MNVSLDSASLPRRALSVLLLTIVLLATRQVHAYAWMIRHGYTTCLPCHLDPSGGGVLTPYGRAQGDLLLQMQYESKASEEPAKSAGFLLGLVNPPEWLLPGGDFRGLLLATKPDGGPTDTEFILMQADLRAGIRLAHWRAAAGVGVVTSNGSAAALTGNLVAREYWAGYEIADDSILFRIGRLNVPYGIRSIEHTLFVRMATRTDLNDTQQHGVAFAYSGSEFRGELLAILGNYQVSPDSFRERGFAGYFEWAPYSQGAIVSAEVALAPTTSPSMAQPSAAESALNSGGVTSPGQSPVASFSVDVSEEAGAVWSRHESSREVRVRLDDGTVSLVVHHGATDKRVIFKVPDGEIEDVGTAFAVSVEKGATRRVVVSEGRVIVRLHGHAAIPLGAGDAWVNEAALAKRASGRPTRRLAAETAPERSSADAPLSASTPESTDGRSAACPADAQWDAAMADFRAQKYESAAARFGTFTSRCAADRRAEDASYLRVVALARAGRADDAKAAAQGYLAAFPSGFRREECRRLLESAKPSTGPSGDVPRDRK